MTTTVTSQPTKELRDDGGSTLADFADRTATVASQAMADARPLVDQASTAIASSTKAVNASSDTTLAFGTASLTGLAIGLLLGGSNRVVVAAALLPATALGYTLLARTAKARKA